MVFGISGIALAEIAYNANSPEHKLDNYCVGVVSFARDLLYNDVQILDGKVWLYTVEPSADVQKARIELADLSNTFILKYKYSKQFNKDYRAEAILVRQKSIDKENESKQGGEYLKKELEMCKRRV
tara:strand:+ start:54 stop:431 length:378 start_codon:yes stop_codon:yes gene_type:complete